MIRLSVARDQMRATVAFEVGDHPREHLVAEATTRIDEAFARGVRQILWRCEVGDVPSRRVAWACGFTFEGGLRRDWQTDGRLTDTWMATLLADDSREPKTRWLDAATLTAPGVVLREETAADEVRYLETMNDPESLTWLGTLSLARTPEGFDSMMARRWVGQSMGSSVAWTVAEPESGRYLASINVFGIGGRDYKSAEVSYRTHPDARGRGVLSSALRRLVTHAFTAPSDGGLGLERLSLGAGAGNIGSQAVARAGGFTETGRDRLCYHRFDGSIVDLIRFDVLSIEGDVT